jgi:hypothetical protein
MPFKKEFKQPTAEEMRILEQFHDWVPLREGFPIETKPVHVGKLRWIPAQMPKEMQVDMNNLNFFLKILKIEGQLFLGNYVDDRSNRYMSTTPSSGGAGAITDFFGSENSQEHFVKRDHEDYQIFIDFGALKQKAAGDEVIFAKLFDEEFKNVLVDIMWQEFFRVNAAELFNFITVMPFLVAGLLGDLNLAQEQSVGDAVVNFLNTYIWWAFLAVMVPRMIDEKFGVNRNTEEFVKVMNFFPQFFLREDHPQLLKHLVKFSDPRNISRSIVFNYIGNFAKKGDRRLIRSEKEADEEWELRWL